jgi:hypothetical protein
MVGLMFEGFQEEGVTHCLSVVFADHFPIFIRIECFDAFDRKIVAPGHIPDHGIFVLGAGAVLEASAWPVDLSARGCADEEDVSAGEMKHLAGEASDGFRFLNASQN